MLFILGKNGIEKQPNVAINVIENTTYQKVS